MSTENRQGPHHSFGCARAGLEVLLENDGMVHAQVIMLSKGSVDGFRCTWLL